MDHETALEIHGVLFDCSRRIEGTARVVRDRCAPDETRAYIKLAAQAMGAVLDLREAIYREHPDLEPEELKRRR